MSIISVAENFKGLSADDRIDPDGRVSGDGDRYFDVTFDEADEASSRPFIAKSESATDPATGVSVPPLGDPHPYDAWIYVLGRNAVVDRRSPFVYHVTVRYQEVRNPLDEPPIIEWLSATSNEVIMFDVDGAAIANSSDEPVDPPHTEDIDDLLLRATYNVSVFNAFGAMGYKGAVNSDLFFGFAPGQAKVMSYLGREIRAITGHHYVEVVLEIQFRKDGWKRKFIDEGFRTKTGTDSDGKPTYTEILDTDGKQISEPVKLDGAGGKLSDGLDPVLIEYWTKSQVNFSSEFGFLGIL